MLRLVLLLPALEALPAAPDAPGGAGPVQQVRPRRRRRRGPGEGPTGARRKQVLKKETRLAPTLWSSLKYRRKNICISQHFPFGLGDKYVVQHVDKSAFY